MSYNIDTLYQDWLSDAKECMPNTEHTFEDFITESFACLQDPDDITDETLFVCRYCVQQDKENPGWWHSYT